MWYFFLRPLKWGIWKGGGAEGGVPCSPPPSFFLSFHHSCFASACQTPAPGWAGGFRECQTPSLPLGDHSLQTCFRHWQAWVFWFTLAVSVVCFLLQKVYSMEHINLSLSRSIFWNIHWSGLCRTVFGTTYLVHFVLINLLMLMGCNCLLWSSGVRWGPR